VINCGAAFLKKKSSILISSITSCPFWEQSTIEQAMLDALGYSAYSVSKSCPALAGLCDETDMTAVISFTRKSATRLKEMKLLIDWLPPCELVDESQICGTWQDFISVELPGDGSCEEGGESCGEVCP
jgi:hypothetical protein